MTPANPKSPSLLEWATLCCVIALPTLALAVKGGANGSYLCLALVSLLAYAFWRSPSAASEFDPPAQPRLLYLGLALPFACVVLNQIVTGEYSWRVYDAPSRFILVLPVIWWLLRLPAPRLRHVQWGLCLGALIALVMVWFAGAGDDLRPRPYFATSITFGNLGLVLGACSLLSLCWRQTRSRLEPALKIVAGAAGFYASFLSQTRGGWVAVPVLLVVLLARLCAGWRAKLILGGLAAVLLSCLYLGSDVVQTRIQSASMEYDVAVKGAAGPKAAPGSKPAAKKKSAPTSIGLRLEFWRTAVELFLREPFVGVGSQNIQAEYRQRIAQGRMSPAAARFGHVHNDYLQYMAAYGLPGLLARLAAYLLPLLCFMRAARSVDVNRSTAGYMGIVLVLAFMVFGLTETMFAITMNASFYCGLLAVFAALSLAPEERRAAQAH